MCVDEKENIPAFHGFPIETRLSLLAIPPWSHNHLKKFMAMKHAFREWIVTFEGEDKKVHYQFLCFHSFCLMGSLPGSAMNASACFSISDFLWCMSVTTFRSPTVSPDICRSFISDAAG